MDSIVDEGKTHYEGCWREHPQCPPAALHFQNDLMGYPIAMVNWCVVEKCKLTVQDIDDLVNTAYQKGLMMSEFKKTVTSTLKKLGVEGVAGGKTSPIIEEKPKPKKKPVGKKVKQFPRKISRK